MGGFVLGAACLPLPSCKLLPCTERQLHFPLSSASQAWLAIPLLYPGQAETSTLPNLFLPFSADLLG